MLCKLLDSSVSCKGSEATLALAQLMALPRLVITHILSKKCCNCSESNMHTNTRVNASITDYAVSESVEAFSAHNLLTWDVSAHSSALLHFLGLPKSASFAISKIKKQTNKNVSPADSALPLQHKQQEIFHQLEFSLNPQVKQLDKPRFLGWFVMIID